ncbi:MAG: ABC transporter ATP-binding protein [Candidatus Eisenbacteria bacterium]|nr:ABC transporter ATP-binding protein [Candidatus Eisenbacteria bacterium]
MRTFLRLLSCVRPSWRRLVAALVCMAVFALLSSVSLGMIVPFVNVLFERGELVGAAPGGNAGMTVAGVRDALRAWLLSFFASDTAAGSLGRMCVAFLVVFLVKSIFGYLQSFLMITVEQRVIRDLRDRLFEHLCRLSLSFFHGKRTGLLISRVTNDVTLVKGALVASFANLFREGLLALLYLGIAVWISWKLSLITFVVLPPILFLIVRVGQRLKKRSARIQEKMADITATLQESITGARVVRAFGMEGHEQRRFSRHTLEYFRTFVRMELLGTLAGPLTEYLGVIGVVVVIWYGGRQVLLDGSVSPDWFLIFLAATLSTMQPLKKLSHANNELQVGLAAAARVFSLLDTPPSVVSRPGAPALDAFRDRIEYRGVRFRYDTGDEVLRGIDLTIARGQIVAIVGASGAGKSTLLDLLPRFYDPTAGSVAIDGHDLRDLDVASVRRLMGVVTQETILFNDTARNNIAYGLEDASREDVVAAARAANAHAFIEALPSGYETPVGERGTRLSGGERQRIAIARAILKNPPILILDEATSSLDTESERLVQEAVERLLRGRTVLVIAHRLSTVRNADRIVVLEKGVVTEEGTHEELMRLGGTYRFLYDIQFRDRPVEPGPPSEGGRAGGA